MIQINDIVIDLDRNVANDGETETRIEPKIARLLQVLVENAGLVVSRDALIDQVWDGAFGADQSLTNGISHLRKILGGPEASGQIIETVPKRGYRLVAEVQQVHPDGSASALNAGGRNTIPRKRVLLGGIAFLAVIAILVATMSILRPSAPSPSTIQEPAGVADATDTFSGTPAASIAVLPFADLSPDGDQEHLSDGISEEILNALANIDGLKVASRTSAFSFKGNDSLRVPEIANVLGVRHVLEGSVRRSGDTIRITAQLIDARTDEHLWSETFDKTLTAESLFAIQDDIARSIAVRIAQDSVSSELAVNSPVRADTISLGAYESYLEARETFIVRSAENLRPTIALFERAVELDPEFARAWSELSAAYQIAPAWVLEDRDYYTLAKEAAERALAIDDQQALPYAVLALGQIEESPANYAEAFRLFEIAKRYEPDSTTISLWRGIAYTATGFFDQAHADLEHCLEIDPGEGSCRNWLALSKLCAGDAEAAFPLFERSAERGIRTHIGVFAKAYAAAGDRKSAIMVWAWDFNGRNYDIDRLYRAHTDPNFDYGLESRIFAAEHESITGQKPNWGRAGAIDAAHTFKRYEDLQPYWWYPVWWLRMHEDFLISPERKRLMREHGIVDYWKAAGFPPQCQPVGTDDFTCN